MEKVREEAITTYEKKIRLSNGAIVQASPSTTKNLAINYSKYVENLIKNAKDTSGNPLISADEVDKLRSE